VDKTNKTFRYIVLGFAQNAREDALKPAILISREAATDVICVVSNQSTLSTLSGPKKAFVEACFAEWTSTPAANTDLLLDSLSELSTGFLRTLQVGKATEEDLMTLSENLKAGRD
jgi:hypothetical protein